jgi:hypothetical protein
VVVGVVCASRRLFNEIGESVDQGVFKFFFGKNCTIVIIVIRGTQWCDFLGHLFHVWNFGGI